MARRCLILSALFGESFGAVMSFLSNLPGVRFELGRDPGRYHERTRRFGTPRWHAINMEPGSEALKLVGYFPKKTTVPEGWSISAASAHVSEICSVSNCIAASPEGWRSE